jgi:hypothetical protein
VTGRAWILVPLALAATGAAAACSAQRSAVHLSEARSVSAATVTGAAPMLAVSPVGTQAVAWVSAPNGGTDGRLYVSAGGARPGELRDSLGPIEPHGEAPPKLAYAPDGSLFALYVVGKVIPNQRWPLGALRIAHSRDDGRTWAAPVTVTDDSTFGSHNFHALYAAPDGALFVTWLDGRQGKSAVYVTRSTDGGATWAPNRRVDVGEACPCCRTAIAARGDTAYVAWRSVLPGNVRAVVVARSTDGGATWGAPVRVQKDDWVFDGCPHAGPALQLDALGRLHVAWWTGKEGAAGVYYARSDDAGRTFGTPIALGTAKFSRPAHVQLAVGATRMVVAAWDDGTVKRPRVLLRLSRDGGGSFAAAQEVSEDDRVATFPVLGVVGTRLTVAWSDQEPAAHDRAAHAMPNMRDPKARMGLPAVGATQVLVREGVLE